jgi:hypothetical protein
MKALKFWLGKAVAHPRSIFDDKKERYLNPEYYLPFFDCCEAIAYEDYPRALLLAEAAMAIAERTQDRHVVHRGLGVQFNAAVALAQWGPAAQWLAAQERAVAGCCELCQAEHLYRRADFALEYRRADETLLHLDACRPGLEKSGRATALGRWHDFRGMALHHRGEQGAAIESVAETLERFPLDVLPRVFFREAVDLLACFLRDIDPAVDARILEILTAFERRLTHVRDCTEIHNHIRWLSGILLGRCDQAESAEKRLERVRWQLRKELGLNRSPKPPVPKLVPLFTGNKPRELVAVSADLGQSKFRNGRVRQDTREGVERMLRPCLDNLALDADLRRTLHETCVAVRRKSPTTALDHLVDLRLAVLVAIPGRLADRYLGFEEVRRRWDERPTRSATPLLYCAAKSPLPPGGS